MNRARLGLLATIATIVTPAASASAGTYIGLGVGTAPNLDGQRVKPDGRSGRLFAGFRFGQISVEGGATFYGVVTTGAGKGNYTAAELFAAGKYSLPLGSGFEAFGRAGLHRTSISVTPDTSSRSGVGVLIGAGFEYKLNLGIGQGSLFVDYTLNEVNLANTRNSQQENAGIWTLGVSLGL